MKAQKIVLLAVIAVISALTLMSGCIEKEIDTKEYQFIDTVTLIKGEMTQVDGSEYYLNLREIRYSADGRRYHKVIISAYKDNGTDFLGQKILGTAGPIEIGELKLSLYDVSGLKEYASVAVYKKV